jgi:outer membrane protein OmpA-like peptidoglycan-associated protein
VNDKAPNDPEDLDGFEDEDGVPDVDNDKDGILDVNDAAPNDAEDFDEFQDEDGAPDPDNDQDGILDEDDKCPNEAETYNDYEDADGCPDKKPEIAVEVGKTIVLEGVYFLNGKATLTANSKTILGKVVRTMQENPDIEVEIWGFSDNRGNYNFNVKLSKRRAESVRTYLMKNGIYGSRISTKGFGPENPIAPNNTKEGRAKNRRIEFYRIK